MTERPYLYPLGLSGGMNPSGCELVLLSNSPGCSPTSSFRLAIRTCHSFEMTEGRTINQCLRNLKLAHKVVWMTERPYLYPLGLSGGMNPSGCELVLLSNSPGCSSTPSFRVAIRTCHSFEMTEGQTINQCLRNLI